MSKKLSLRVSQIADFDLVVRTRKQIELVTISVQGRAFFIAKNKYLFNSVVSPTKSNLDHNSPNNKKITQFVPLQIKAQFCICSILYIFLVKEWLWSLNIYRKSNT